MPHVADASVDTLVCVATIEPFCLRAMGIGLPYGSRLWRACHQNFGCCFPII